MCGGGRFGGGMGRTRAVDVTFDGSYGQDYFADGGDKSEMG